MISPSQITLIHIAKQQLGITPDQYAAMLDSFNVISSKFLTSDQAKQLIEQFVKLGFKITPKPKSNTLAPDARASAKQILMIDALWKQHPHVRDHSSDALNHFIKRILGIDRIQWVPANRIYKLKRAIESLSPPKELQNETRLD